MIENNGREKPLDGVAVVAGEHQLACRDVLAVRHRREAGVILKDYLGEDNRHNFIDGLVYTSLYHAVRLWRSEGLAGLLSNNWSVMARKEASVCLCVAVCTAVCVVTCVRVCVRV